MDQRRTILITGAEGRVGTRIVPLLQRYGCYDLRCGHARGFDEPERLLNPTVCQLEDYESVLAAAQGVDTIIHLAVVGLRGGRDYVERMVPANIVGTYHICEAAVAAGCRRVIFASSIHAVANYWELDHQPVDIDQPARPTSLYGVTKAYGEILGRYYVDSGRLPSFLALRIGSFVREEDIQGRRLEPLYIWTSPRDLTHLIERCIEAPPEVRYGVLPATSDNDRQLMPLEPAKQLVGYQPQDNAEDLLDRFTCPIPDWLVRRRA